MGIVFRQSVKTTIVIFAGAFLGAVTNWLYTFAIAKQLLGFSRSIVNYGAIIQYISLLGMGPALQTFLPRFAKDSRQKQVLQRIALCTPVVMVSLLLVPYYALQPQVLSLFQPQDQPLWRHFYSLVPPLILLWALMTLLDVFLVTHHKTAIASFNREVVLRLGLLAILLLYHFRVLTFNAFMWATLLAYAAPVLLMLLQARRIEGFGLRGPLSAFSRAQYREIISYAWYHLLTGTTTNLLGFLDMLMLASLDKDGFKSAAVYSIALFIATLLMIPYRAIINASFPTINEAYILKDTVKVKDLFSRSSINILIVGVAMVALTAPNLYNAARFFAAGYEAIVPLTLIMMIGRVVDMATGLNEILISISEHYRFNFRISALLVLLLLVLNRLLIPNYSVYGAAWATTIGLALFNAGKGIFLYKKMGLQPFSVQSIKVILAGALAAGAGYLMPRLSLGAVAAEAGGGLMAGRLLWILADTALRSALILAVYGAALLWLRPSPDLSGYLHSIRKNKRLF